MEYILLYVLIFLFGILTGRILNVRFCKIRYPVVELLNGLGYLWIFSLKGPGTTGILFCICASALIVISVTDWRTYVIPPGCNIVIGILGIIQLLLDFTHWYDYAAGSMAVSGLFLIVFFATKGKGIGGGDIKLMAAAGLFLGWQKILLSLMVGSIAGSVIHLALMKLQKKDRVLAFGPYLALGIFISMLYGNELIKWYLSFTGLSYTAVFLFPLHNLWILTHII